MPFTVRCFCFQIFVRFWTNFVGNLVADCLSYLVCQFFAGLFNFLYLILPVVFLLFLLFKLARFLPVFLFGLTVFVVVKFGLEVFCQFF